MSINYYKSYPDPIWDRIKETTNKADDLRDHLLYEYNCNITMFIESYMQLDVGQALNDEDLMMMLSSGKAPRDIANDIFAEYQQNKTQRSMLGSSLI